MSGTPNGTRVPTGSGRSIESFVDDARALSLEDFEDRHGGGFLLLTAAGFKPDGGSTSTEMILLDEPANAAERTAGVSVLVFSLLAASSAHTHLVTVGRTSKCDVTIPDISVSRFHAYFKRASSGTYQVLDAGSTNGTTVNGRSVPTKGTGAPVDLKAGDSVRLGQMEFTFLGSAALRDFAQKFEPKAPKEPAA